MNFRLKIIILTVLIMLTNSCDLKNPKAIDAQQQLKDAGFKIIKIIPNNTLQSKTKIIQFEYKDHLYVLVQIDQYSPASVGGITHDPNCKCFKNK